MKHFLFILLLVFPAAVRAAEVMPPAPKQFFNDYAGKTSADTRQRLNGQLEQFERDTSNQILVAVYPKMETDSSIEDYTVRVAQSWKVGQQGKKNGAVLFVFVQDRKMRIEVGYGLEPVLTDILCKQIIEDEIKPHFKEGDYDAGLSAGVAAMMQAARGEYKGTGRLHSGQGRRTDYLPMIFLALFFGFIIFNIIRSIRNGGTVYGNRGRYISPGWGGWGWGSGGGWSSGGGSWGGGGGGGGGFSGGGGSFGGGGASGSW